MPHPEKRDLADTTNRLAAWLRDRLAGSSAVRIDGLRGPSETGFSSDTLLFDAHWRDASGEHCDRLVVRFKPGGFLVFPRYDIAQQYRVMKILGEATDVPVPRMRWLESDVAPLGAEFYVMDQVPGRIPSDMPPYHVGGWLTELTPDERQRLWWNGLEAMTRVHRLDWKALAFDWLAEPQRGATPLDQQLQFYEEFFEWAVEDRDHYPLIRRVQRWLRDHRPPPGAVGLCWGDSRPSNQIFDDQLRCVAVIDWEMVRLGDPVQDLAWWLILDRCLSEGIGAQRLPGLPDRADTIARWEQLVGRPARDVPYYEVMGLYKFAVIMARITRQMKHYEALPPENDMDVNNLASVTLQRVFAEVAG